MSYYVPPPGASGNVVARGLFWVEDGLLIPYEDDGSPYNQYIYMSRWLEAGSGIVEQGSNSNGYYVVFSSGLQICFGPGFTTNIQTVYDQAVGTYGWSFYITSSNPSITFPKAFSTVWDVLPSPASGNTSRPEYVSFVSLTTTGCTAVPRHHASTASAVWNYMAIGVSA